MTQDAMGQAEQIQQFSQKALELAAEHSTPPVPQIYEIWYNYASGDVPALNARIDDAGADQPLNEESIKRLHGQFFSDMPMRVGVSDLSSEFEEKLDGVLEITAGGVAEGGDYAAALQQLIIKLANTAGTQDLERLAQKLASLSESHVTKTRELTQEMISAKDQIALLREQLNDLQQDVLRDHLTQLYNRRHFDVAINKEIERARGKREPLCLAIADIDRFKEVNDIYGHNVGDRVIMKFAEILRKNTKNKDTPARIGGEEFAIILPNTNLSGAAALAGRLREYFGASRVTDPNTGQKLGRITASFGVAELCDDDDALSLTHRADMLLFGAKNAGRNTVKAGHRADILRPTA